MFFHHQMLRKNYSLKENKEWTNKNRNKNKIKIKIETKKKYFVFDNFF